MKTTKEFYIWICVIIAVAAIVGIMPKIIALTGIGYFCAQWYKATHVIEKKEETT